MSLEGLYLGLVEYHWVRSEADGKYLVTDWNGNERVVDGGPYHVRPDLETGADGVRRPVFRRIHTGTVAQYFRFERKDGA